MSQFGKCSFLQLVAIFVLLHQQYQQAQGQDFWDLLWRSKPPSKPKQVQDASLYPGSFRSGLKLDFSATADFSDISRISRDEGFLSVGLFCIKLGAFILYRRPHYATDLTDDVKLASGEQRCFKPVGIDSAQPIGSINKPKKDSITFFTKPNFGSIAHPTSESVRGGFFRSMKATVKSIITVGTQGWTIQTALRRKFCLQPKMLDKDEKSPICLLPDFTVTKIGRVGINIFEVQKGCEPGNGTSISLIALTFCSYWGSVPKAPEGRSLLSDLEGSSKLSARASDNFCTAGDSDVIQTTAKMYKAIITSSYDRIVILSWKDLGKSKWKLELIDTIFAISKAAIPRELVSENFMNRVREYYVYLLTQAWKRTKGSGGAAAESGVGQGGTNGTATEEGIGLLKEYDYRGMLYQTTQCLGMVDPSILVSNSDMWNGITDPNNIGSTIWKGLLRQNNTSIIMEMTWLITNMVGGICHKVFGYAHNYWTVYIHLIYNMYLKPCVPEWKKSIPNLDILLGGDMDIQYKKLAMFTSMALYSSNSLEPFQRPSLEEPQPDDDGTTPQPGEGGEGGEGGETTQPTSAK